MTAPCFICRRASIRGLTYKGRPVCAHDAPNAMGGEMMLEFSETEVEAIDAGGETAGAYLDELDKTDLATLSGDEWRAFLGKFLAGYSEHMQAEAAKYPPF